GGGFAARHARVGLAAVHVHFILYLLRLRGAEGWRRRRAVLRQQGIGNDRERCRRDRHDHPLHRNLLCEPLLTFDRAVFGPVGASLEGTSARGTAFTANIDEIVTKYVSNGPGGHFRSRFTRRSTISIRYKRYLFVLGRSMTMAYSLQA